MSPVSARCVWRLELKTRRLTVIQAGMVLSLRQLMEMLRSTLVCLLEFFFFFALIGVPARRFYYTLW